MEDEIKRLEENNMAMQLELSRVWEKLAIYRAYIDALYFELSKYYDIKDSKDYVALCASCVTIIERCLDKLKGGKNNV